MRSRKGLTLIELLIVVIILGALAAIAIPRITTSATTAKSNACRTNVDTLNTAIEMYHMDSNTSAWPDDLSDLTTYFPDGEPACPFGTTAYSIDPATHRIITSTHNHLE